MFQLVGVQQFRHAGASMRQPEEVWDFTGQTAGTAGLHVCIPCTAKTGPYNNRVDGDAICRMTVNAALDQLKYRASIDYEYVRKYVGEINFSARAACYVTGFKPGEQPFYTVCIALRE
jgi:hypothetical protein